MEKEKQQVYTVGNRDIDDTSIDKIGKKYLVDYRYDEYTVCSIYLEADSLEDAEYRLKCIGKSGKVLGSHEATIYCGPLPDSIRG